MQFKNIDTEVLKEPVKTELRIDMSPQFRLTTQDWAKWFENQKVFLAPLGVFYLIYVIGGINADGVQLTDFQPNNNVISAMSLYVLNAVLDLLRKWVPASK